MGGSGVLGSFEELVLLGVARLRGEAYGVSLRRALADATGTRVSMGAVHATLDRLEEKGLVVSEHRKTSSGPGRPRRYFAITTDGENQLLHAEGVRSRLESALGALGTPEGGIDG